MAVVPSKPAQAAEVTKDGNTIVICPGGNDPQACMIVFIPTGQRSPQVGDTFLLPDGSSMVIGSVAPSTGTPELTVDVQ